MAFKKMEKAPYPPRLWALVGYPGSGKSTFARQMRTPMLPIDADHRFGEVLDLGAGDVYELSDTPADHVDPDRIAAILAANMPGSGVRTIVVDSLTAIISPLVVKAIVDKDLGREKNLAAAFRTKALAMRQLQDAVTRWGCDTLWIYHLNDARDAHGRELTKATVSQTELARLLRSINLQIEIVVDGQRRGAKVAWARRGRAGAVLWDESGTWAGMPERIEEAVYGGLSQAEQDAIEGQAPAVFPNPETAIAWGVDQGAFQALQHARNAYEKLKRERKPATAAGMAALWVADVEARLLEIAAGEGDGDDGGDGAQEHVPAQALAQAPAEPSPAATVTPTTIEAPTIDDAPPPPVPEEDDLDDVFPRHEPTPAAKPSGGNGSTVPTSPKALLAALHAEVPGYFRDVPGLLGALKAEMGEAYTWPAARDVDGWRKAQEAGRKCVRKHS